MKIPGDEILRTYIDDDGTEVTVVMDEDGKEYHCWEINFPKNVEQMIRNDAKKHGIEEWEYVNIILETSLKQHEEQQETRKFIEEISD